MTEINSVEDVYRNSHHSFRKDFKDAYKVDLDLLKIIEKQVAPFCNYPMSYSIELEGGYNTTGDNYDAIVGSPLIATRKIRAISLNSRSGDSFRFSFRVGNSSLGSSAEIWGYDDPLKYEGLLQQINAQMKALRPWYWSIYRLPVEGGIVIALGILAAVLAKEWLPNSNPDARSFIVGVTFIAAAGLVKWLLFSRVEFLEGVSKRYADRRAAWQKFIGVTVIAGTLLAIGREYFFKGSP